MKSYKYISLLILSMFIFGIGCDNQKRQVVTHVHHQKQHVYFYNGHYCYHDDNWIWYYLMMNNSGNNNYYSTPTQQSITPATTSGARWIKAEQPPEEEVNEIKAEEAQIATNPTTAPENEQTIDVNQSQTEQTIDIPEANSLDSMEGIESSPSETSSSGPIESSSESSSSSSSDSSSDSGSSGGE